MRVQDTESWEIPGPAETKECNYWLSPLLNVCTETHCLLPSMWQGALQVHLAMRRVFLHPSIVLACQVMILCVCSQIKQKSENINIKRRTRTFFHQQQVLKVHERNVCMPTELILQIKCTSANLEYTILVLAQHFKEK